MAKHVFVFHFESDNNLFVEQQRMIAALRHVLKETGESLEGTSATLDQPLTQYSSDKLRPFLHKGG